MGNIWWLYHPSSFTAALRTLNNFIEPFVERAAMQDEDSLQDKQQTGQAMNFTDSLSQFTKDRQVLRDQLVNALIAGRDTTAACLSWLFLELSYRPDLYAKLREEVLSTLNRDAKPTYEDLKNMKFLQHCLNEGQYYSEPFHTYNPSVAPISDRSIQRSNRISRYHFTSWRRPCRARRTFPDYSR
jgi:cytochrome P450